MDLTETYFDTGEVRLHVMEGPHNGPPLVLLHGATGRWEDWQPLLPLLAPHWHIYAPDLRGHGLSGRAPDGVAGYHISAFVRDAVALLHGLVEEPAVLFGHSWGALTTLLVAGSEGRAVSRGLRAAVAEDPPVMVYRNALELAPYLDYFGWALGMKQKATTYEEVLAAVSQMTATFPDPPPESDLPGWAENLLHLDPDFLRMTLSGSEAVGGIDFEHAFEAIACPLLLLQADPAKQGCLLEPDFRLIQSQAPAAQRVYFPGAGHGIHTERPQEVAKVFAGFIKGLEEG